MREISEAFAARLAADGTTLCVCWRFTRTDGAIFGATDHDEVIYLDALACMPSNGLSGATFESSSGLAPGRAAAGGAISFGFIDPADLDAGLWDSARVDVFRVDWRAPEHRVCIWSGRLSEIERRGEAFTAELVSLKAQLERSIGRVYGRACDARVGDGRCGVDLGNAAYRCAGEVLSVLSEKGFLVAGLAEFQADWFVEGVLTWTSGANAGGFFRVHRHAGDEVKLSAQPRFAVESGDTFVVTAGCDKSFGMCSTKFANVINFRGFPHMPGAEAVLTGPAADAQNDGGSRR